jgi:serine protease Do
MMVVTDRQSHSVKAFTIWILFVVSALIAIASLRIAKEAGAVSHSGTVMIPANFSELAKTTSPAVVNIRTVKTIKGGGRVFKHFQGPFGNQDPFKDFFEKFFGDIPEQNHTQRSLGSGFIIDKEGFIVTNNHVIEGADKIRVKLVSGQEFDADIIGKDSKTDIALIKIKATEDLPTATLGDSETIFVGDWVLAIGSPFGLEHTVTAGIVSAKGRVIGSGPYDDFIQTDASINPGNSGGPLIDINGKVVGINTAIIAGGQGIGFAIPINMARNIIEQLKKQGHVTRGWLGVSIQDLTPELAEYYGIKDGIGALVGEVFKDDPADKAGIKPKDIIVEVNGNKISDSRDLSRLIADVPVGDKIEVKIIRNGKEKILYPVITKRTDDKEKIVTKEGGTESDFGITVTDITPEIADRYGIEDTQGVVIVKIDPDGKGAASGLLNGDIIKEINRKSIHNVKEYQKRLRELKDERKLRILVRRKAIFMIIELEQ